MHRNGYGFVGGGGGKAKPGDSLTCSFINLCVIIIVMKIICIPVPRPVRRYSTHGIQKYDKERKL